MVLILEFLSLLKLPKGSAGGAWCTGGTSVAPGIVGKRALCFVSMGCSYTYLQASLVVLECSRIQRLGNDLKDQAEAK